MAYSNDQIEIRAGLVNYIGAMLKASPYENDRAKKHNVVSILLEEAMKLSKDSNGEFDIYVCKPIFRLVSGIAKQRSDLMSNCNLGQEGEKLIQKYNSVSNNLNEIVKNTNL
jgi:Mor family transcriptional regulator